MKAIIGFALIVAVSAWPSRPIKVPEIPESRIELRYWEPQPPAPPAPPHIRGHSVLEAILSELANSPNADEYNSEEERITAQDIIDALNTIHEIIQNHHNHGENTTPDDQNEPPIPTSGPPHGKPQEPVSDESQGEDDESEQPQDEAGNNESESASEVPQNEVSEDDSGNALTNEPGPPADESASVEQNESQESESASNNQSEADVEIVKRSVPIQSIDVSNLAISSPADVAQQSDAERMVQLLQPYLYTPLRPEDIRINIPGFQKKFYEYFCKCEPQEN